MPDALEEEWDNFTSLTMEEYLNTLRDDDPKGYEELRLLLERLRNAH